MSVSRLKAKARKRGHRIVAAVNGAPARGAAFAKVQAGELAAQGQRLARRVDRQVDRYTGRRSAAWIDRVSRWVTDLRWGTLALGGLALFALFTVLV